jgi:hypothetical protein
VIHAIIALAIMAVLLFVPQPYASAAAATLHFLGREIAQAEYRWIEANGGLRAGMEWWRGCVIADWPGHSLSGVLAPALVTFGLAFLIERYALMALLAALLG